MTQTWRPRDSRGHYLASKDVHTTLDPEDWDDTCRHKPAPTELGPSAEDFGHQPEPVYAPGPLGPGDDQQMCTRCRVGYDIVLWPCTSAIVLGLASA
ncbi:hypothetical protein [Streptomyces griseosporeus]|uniref:hypothetical protein n=1 Tax=Streptomyces griseosporeus TaxID=1910 RepID=UPI0036FD8108